MVRFLGGMPAKHSTPFGFKQFNNDSQSCCTYDVLNMKSNRSEIVAISSLFEMSMKREAPSFAASNKCQYRSFSTLLTNLTSALVIAGTQYSQFTAESFNHLCE